MSIFENTFFSCYISYTKILVDFPLLYSKDFSHFLPYLLQTKFSNTGTI